MSSPKRSVPLSVPLGVLAAGDRMTLFVRGSGTAPRTAHLRISTSANGWDFTLSRILPVFFDPHGQRERTDRIERLECVQTANQLYVMLYQTRSRGRWERYVATSADALVWKSLGRVPFGDVPVVLASEQVNGEYVAFAGRGVIDCYQSRDLVHWQLFAKNILPPRANHFDSGMLSPCAAIARPEGTLLVYCAEDRRTRSARFIGAALLDRRDPRTVIARTEDPLWERPAAWDNQVISPLGARILHGRLLCYWLASNGDFQVVGIPYADEERGMPKPPAQRLVHRAAANPILEPRASHSWESMATFNPAAVYEDGKVHLLYRAMGNDWISVLGHATSRDGTAIEGRGDYPAYTAHAPFEVPLVHAPSPYMSGGGYGGCEDPRLTRIGDRIYMLYVAYDGANPPRVAMTSIARADFVNERWLWTRPVLITPYIPGEGNKNACLFPEKINGKYVFLHRLFPDILIDFVDDLDFDGETKWLAGQHRISPRPNLWDSRKIGAGPPPIKTKHGWLLIYQGVGEQDLAKYKIGAMLLDLNDPTKVLARARQPILEPAEWYENEGHKFGVVYPCGAAVIEDRLLIYYGGADKVTCVATAPLEEFLQELMRSEKGHLRTVTIRDRGAP